MTPSVTFAAARHATRHETHPVTAAAHRLHQSTSRCDFLLVSGSDLRSRWNRRGVLYINRPLNSAEPQSPTTRTRRTARGTHRAAFATRRGYINADRHEVLRRCVTACAKRSDASGESELIQSRFTGGAAALPSKINGQRQSQCFTVLGGH